jgi:hypothetical protein
VRITSLLHAVVHPNAALLALLHIQTPIVSLAAAQTAAISAALSDLIVGCRFSVRPQWSRPVHGDADVDR